LQLTIEIEITLCVGICLANISAVLCGLKFVSRGERNYPDLRPAIKGAIQSDGQFQFALFHHCFYVLTLEREHKKSFHESQTLPTKQKKFFYYLNKKENELN
jgi:PHP family Zn ribbon phosphoesterase